jgi:glycosyltransferase involved in cell wall biosynthesis
MLNDALFRDVVASVGGAGQAAPAVSFVIPAYNESGHIAKCVAAITEACAVAALSSEIIVVDNGSSDDTATVARVAGATAISIPRSTVSSARNIGARLCGSDVIAFIDADVILTKEWGATLGAHLQGASPQFSVTGWQYVIRDDGNWLEQYWFARLTDRLLNGGNLIVGRSAFDLVGGFNPALRTGEDYDLCRRLMEAGVEYRPDPGFRAIHMGYPRTVRGFIRREVWHGEGDAQSIRHLVRSPVAILSIIYLFAHFLTAALVLTMHLWSALLSVAVLLLLNTGLASVRTRTLQPVPLLGASVANYLYFVARGVTILRRTLGLQ